MPAKPIAPLISGVLEAIWKIQRWLGFCTRPERRGKGARVTSTSGYTADIGKIVNGAIYEVKYDEMVIVKDIEFFSMCEHHMLPFFGKMHIAYIARNKVIGLSKLPRIVDIFARRLQIQERLTQEVAQCIQDMLDPLGVGVIAEAQHFCMMMRGVEKQHSGTVTKAIQRRFWKNKENAGMSFWLW